MNAPPVALGTRLREHRESRGLTLEEVAAATKIKGSLLADLERNDVSRWPQGIYGRAFLRAYADAIGISPALLLDHLGARLGERTDSGRSPVSVARTGAADEPLRLTLAPQFVKPRLALAQVADAAVVLAAVLAVSAVVATAAGVAFLTATAAVALVWYPAAHALFGGFSPARWLARSRQPFAAHFSRNRMAGGLPLRIVAPANQDADSVPVAEHTLQQAS